MRDEMERIKLWQSTYDVSRHMQEQSAICDPNSSGEDCLSENNLATDLSRWKRTYHQSHLRVKMSINN